MLGAGGREEARVATTEHDDVEVTSTRAEPLEGDDITVIPEPDDQPRGTPRRIAILSAIAIVLVAAVVAIVLGTRGDDSTPQVQASNNSPVATSPPVVKKKPKPAATKKKATTTNRPVTHVTAAPVVVAPETPVSSVVTDVQSVPTMPAEPQTSPVSVLRWNVPQSVTVKSGASTSVTVSAYNPSAGVVTLPVPLSCAPRLQGDGVCPEMAQLISPGETANATYTIDATGVKPGTYSLKAAGVAPFTVTVTA